MKQDRAKLTVSSAIATVYPLGFMPKAPGTWGSIPGVLVGLGIYHGVGLINQGWMRWALACVLLFLLSVLAYWTIKLTEEAWQSHDDKRIVIDEVVGQAIPLAFFGHSLIWVLASFVLFRFFDIAKPGPIGWADRKVAGAWGTLLDDIFAGIAVMLVWLVVLVLTHYTL